MGVKLSNRIRRSYHPTGKGRIHRVDYAYLAMERKRVSAEIKELNKTLYRLHNYETALIAWHRDHQNEDVHEIIERIATRRTAHRERLSDLRKITDDLAKIMEIERFIESEWCQFLLLGNSLTAEDILTTWAEEAEQIWKDTNGKKVHPGTKITEDKIQRILALHDAGLTADQIAERMGISTYPVRKYIKERSD